MGYRVYCPACPGGETTSSICTILGMLSSTDQSIIFPQRNRRHQFCIPSRFPLSYLLKPNSNIVIAKLTNSNVNPIIPQNSGHEKCVSNCKGTNEMNPAGITVKRKIRTTPLKMFMG